MLRAISCFFCRSLAEFCKEFQRSGFDAAAPERNNLFLFLSVVPPGETELIYLELLLEGKSLGISC